MEQLQKEFIGKGEVSGVQFFQVWRGNDTCIYYRGNGLFEVIKVRFQKEQLNRKIGGVLVNFEAKEVYPKGEAWGQQDICTNNIERALEYASVSSGIDSGTICQSICDSDLHFLPTRLKTAFTGLLQPAGALTMK